MRTTLIGHVSAPYVAIVAENLETGRETMFDNPTIKTVPAASESGFSTVFSPVKVGFPAALANPSISVHHTELSGLDIVSSLAFVLLVIATRSLPYLNSIFFVIAKSILFYFGRVFSFVDFVVFPSVSGIFSLHGSSRLAWKRE